jgi:hypothetical protein
MSCNRSTVNISLNFDNGAYWVNHVDVTPTGNVGLATLSLNAYSQYSSVCTKDDARPNDSSGNRHGNHDGRGAKHSDDCHQRGRIWRILLPSGWYRTFGHVDPVPVSSLVGQLELLSAAWNETSKQYKGCHLWITYMRRTSRA